jgi:hypothetical protein
MSLRGAKLRRNDMGAGLACHQAAVYDFPLKWKCRPGITPTGVSNETSMQYHRWLRLRMAVTWLVKDKVHF